MEVLSISNERDQKIGIISAVLSMVLVFLVLYFITFEKADPGPAEIKVPTEIPMTQIEIVNLKVAVTTAASGSEGAPSDAPIDPNPKPVTEKMLITKNPSKTKVRSGEGNVTNAVNSKEKSTSKKESNNPFASGGNSDKGNGTSFGKDGGGPGGNGEDGVGPGNGGGIKERILQIKPNVENIVSEANCRIYLKVKIDASGNVIQADNIPSSTTTTSQTLINKVIAATIAQARYNKKPGAKIEYAYINYSLKAS